MRSEKIVTREFYADLERIFPRWNQTERTGFHVSRFNWEQYFIAKCNAVGHLKKEQIEKIAARTLKGLAYVISEASPTGIPLQGAEENTVLVGFKPRRSGQIHFIGFEQEGFPKAIVSHSWHGSYGFTSMQHKKYLELLVAYFSQIPHQHQARKDNAPDRI